MEGHAAEARIAWGKKRLKKADLRGMKGIYQHCAEKHLHRYLAEFDYRYNRRVGLGIDDKERSTQALMGVKGKRLTYNQTGIEGAI